MTANEIKFIKKLHQKKYRKEEGKYFVEGKKLVDEALENCPHLIEFIYTSDSNFEASSEVNIQSISPKEMSRITALKTPSPFLAVIKMNSTEPKKKSKTLFLENIKDPGNFGTIIRSVDWFGMDAVYYSPECVDIYNPKVIQATMGSFFRVPLIEKASSELRAVGSQIIGATLQGNDLGEFVVPENFCLVIGSESHGISEDLISQLDQQVKIPGYGKAESLNASVAAGILLFAFSQS
ncbi:MAG: RNA methyltransferase [Crocinitomicaceae bacterium]|nr:RNA methyltransferase [Crocinitomicaceae bacterium]